MELINQTYFSLIDKVDQEDLLNQQLPEILRNVAFDDNIPLKIKAQTKSGNYISIKGTINIVNDLNEPSFLLNIIEYSLAEGKKPFKLIKDPDSLPT